ncbi:MAG: hypothetical protein IPI02_19025 [Sterolibacteriaceae bacterium]|nr:hypothetical protein [Sterolibacteriaceae bacterium]
MKRMKRPIFMDGRKGGQNGGIGKEAGFSRVFGMQIQRLGGAGRRI